MVSRVPECDASKVLTGCLCWLVEQPYFFTLQRRGGRGAGYTRGVGADGLGDREKGHHVLCMTSHAAVSASVASSCMRVA